MGGTISRRDFLKIAGLLSGAALPPFIHSLPARSPAAAGKKNVLIVVFDALSAHHLSLLGYARETMPNLARLADRAIVYHNHFAAGNFTMPGTASLFTGVYPWTHRAFRLIDPMAPPFDRRTLFNAFPDHHTIVYSHNPLVYVLLDQFRSALEEYVPLHDLLLTSDWFVRYPFSHDDDTASLSAARTLKKALNGGFSYSLLLSQLYEKRIAADVARLRESFPRGVPYIRGDTYYVLSDAIDFLAARVAGVPQPFLSYFHFFPPHAPYNTRMEFYNRFWGDSFTAVDKPRDMFGHKRWTPAFLARMRTQYDEHILYVDHEFARLYQLLEGAGILEDTWLILTSDHGELFERAIWAHSTPVLYQPVVQIPLLIFQPGRRGRLDVHAPTSTVDLLPTLIQVCGGRPADWAEGVVLPPFAGAFDTAKSPQGVQTPPNNASSQQGERSIYALEAKNNARHLPLTQATVMLVKGRHKLTRFFGYPDFETGVDRIELYDLAADPEELNNLVAAQPGLASVMLDELNAKLAEVNRPFN